MAGSRSGQDDALEAALAALRRRDHSVHELDERLRHRGFPEAAREGVVRALLRTGLLDDARFAEARALQLAGRGSGDALIRHALESAGVSAELVDAAISSLESEAERARSVVARRGPGIRTARYLSGKGFSDDVVGVVAAPTGEELG